MSQTATFASGCFWCTEAIFKRIKGILTVMSGYAGGTVANPSYDEVSNGTTGAAEAIQVTFDPDVISYGKILEIFFHLHNPTTLNRQGADMGTQYRSAIFYHDTEQQDIAENLKKKLDQSGVFSDKIVTEIVPYTTFAKAEEHHQDYYDRNKDQPYCQVVIDPKIQKLLREYKKDLKEEYN